MEEIENKKEITGIEAANDKLSSWFDRNLNFSINDMTKKEKRNWDIFISAGFLFMAVGVVYYPKEFSQFTLAVLCFYLGIRFYPRN